MIIIITDRPATNTGYVTTYVFPYSEKFNSAVSDFIGLVQRFGMKEKRQGYYSANEEIGFILARLTQDQLAGMKFHGELIGSPVIISLPLNDNDYNAIKVHVSASASIEGKEPDEIAYDLTEMKMFDRGTDRGEVQPNISGRFEDLSWRTIIPPKFMGDSKPYIFVPP
jgi:hypothetical protein